MIAGKIGDTGVIQSPHFPNPYPRDYSNEVRLQVAEDQAAIIQLIFDDFQLTSVSLIEVCLSRAGKFIDATDYV